MHELNFVRKNSESLKAMAKLNGRKCCVIPRNVAKSFPFYVHFKNE